MEFSQVGLDFSKLVIEEFGAPYRKEEIEKKKEEIQQKYKQIEEQSQQQQSVQDKYSLDYDKKFNTVNDEEQKQKELDDIMQSNPYLQSMGCSHDRRKERELFEKTTKEKLDNSEYFKNEGNKAIKEKDYEKAAYFYQKALLQFDYTFPDTKEEQDRMDLLNQQCYVNMALVKYYQKEYNESMQNANQALKINPKNIKALFRIATIHLDRDQYDQTENVINQIEQIENNQEVQNLKKQLAVKKIEYSKGEKKMYAEIFTSLKGGEEENTSK